MSRALVAGALAVLAAVVSSLTGLVPRPGSHGTPADTSALAVLHEHVGYEIELIDQVLPELDPPDARTAAAVRAVTAALDAQLTARLRDLGYSPARAHAIWQQAIGDGAAPPGRVLAYVCSIHASQSERAELAVTPPGSLAAALGDIELTLFVEGRQLAGVIGGGALSLGAAADQRDALHLLAPLLIPTDRAFATAA